MDYNPKIKTFYHPHQAVTSQVGYSRSPEKPALLLQFLKDKKLFDGCFELEPGFTGFTDEEFMEIHSRKYVQAFFSGTEPLCSSNGLKWNPEFARSVRYTNASLYESIKFALENPTQITFSPTSGFHHSLVSSGSAYCSMAGQVLASVRLFKETGKSGAYLDLDGHYGNSIEDARGVVAFLNDAVPEGFNFNPAGTHRAYIKDFGNCLDKLDYAVRKKQISYVVFAHGCDSHEWLNLSGNQSTTAEWLLCSKMFYDWAKQLKFPFSITLSLFGGYFDDMNSLLSLHTADLVICLNTLCGHNISFSTEVKPKARKYNNEVTENVEQGKLF